MVSLGISVLFAAFSLGTFGRGEILSILRYHGFLTRDRPLRVFHTAVIDFIRRTRSSALLKSLSFSAEGVVGNGSFTFGTDALPSGTSGNDGNSGSSGVAGSGVINGSGGISGSGVISGNSGGSDLSARIRSPGSLEQLFNVLQGFVNPTPVPLRHLFETLLALFKLCATLLIARE